jgi:(p)ppGpp synthase/HD superfamily hydrolase
VAGRDRPQPPVRHRPRRGRRPAPPAGPQTDRDSLYSHLLAVAALVLEYGGDEDQAIAGLLHDVVEDRGGTPTLTRIRATFGDRVADIVAACSDTLTDPKPPWRPRKETYLLHLRTAPAEVLLVSLADKLHNARSILRDLRTVGPEVWERFNAGVNDQLWYYRSLAQTFSKRLPGPAADELLEVVESIVRLSEQASRAEDDR